jgi:hypothetical protein
MDLTPPFFNHPSSFFHWFITYTMYQRHSSKKTLRLLLLPHWHLRKLPGSEASGLFLTSRNRVFEETGNTLFLLYHLIMRQPSQADGNEPARTSPRYIKDCLDHPPDTRALDGVDHLFHVALSRLSFAEPPDFLSDDQKIDHRYMQGQFLSSLLRKAINIDRSQISPRSYLIASWTMKIVRRFSVF